MAAESGQLSSTGELATLPALSPQLKRTERAARIRTALLLAPAGALAALLLYAPLAFIVNLSFTEGSSFLSPAGPVYSLANYAEMVTRYLPNLFITIQLATLAMLVDLVFGFPFAYILVRRVRYRDLVRAIMVFPMFGALYVAFGLSFILLPGGPLDPVFNLLGISSTALLFSLPAVVFAMAIFTFPFMVMSIGTALSNVDPMLEEAAACLGARPWQTFWRIVLPLTRAGVVAGALMVFGWSIGAFAEPLLLGSVNEQRSLALALYQRAVVENNYGLGSTMGVVLMGLAFVVTYFALRYSRGALVE
jgi:ABC-type spermidine/putrescine transport system permease subunit I